MIQPIFTENIETVMKASPNNSPNKMKEFLHTYNLKRVVKTRLILTETGKTFLGYYYNKDETFTHFKHQKSTKTQKDLKNSIKIVKNAAPIRPPNREDAKAADRARAA